MQMLSSGPKIYVGDEHSEIAIPLDLLLINGELEIFPEIAKHDICHVRSSSKKGMIFQAGRYIGIIPINRHVTINVRPRVPLKNLERIFAKSRTLPNFLNGFKDWFDSHEESHEPLLDFITDALLSAIKVVRHLGLYKEYQRKEELTASPKGRLSMGKLARLSNSRPLDVKITCAWFERTVDNSPNRCILVALEALAKKYSRLINQQGALSRLRQINESAFFRWRLKRFASTLFT